jgi:PAS domain S-box-containing protein
MGPFSLVPLSALSEFVPLWLTPLGVPSAPWKRLSIVPSMIRLCVFGRFLIRPPALIHTGTPDGYLDFFNRTWCKFVGKPVEELYGWEWTSCVHPDDIGVLLEKWRESIATGNPLETEARVRRADGEFCWMLHQKIAQRTRRVTSHRSFGYLVTSSLMPSPVFSVPVLTPFRRHWP